MVISNQRQFKIIYLAQTDTTAGFLSLDELALAKAKQRNPNQPFLICVDTLQKQKKLTRTPKKHKKLVRRANKISFIYPNSKAVRIVKDNYHSQFLKKFDFLYSTSANITGKNFNNSLAQNKADVIILDKRGLHDNSPSKIFKLSKNKISQLR